MGPLAYAVERLSEALFKKLLCLKLVATKAMGRRHKFLCLGDQEGAEQFRIRLEH